MTILLCMEKFSAVQRNLINHKFVKDSKEFRLLFSLLSFIFMFGRFESEVREVINILKRE